MLAKNVNDNEGVLNEQGALGFFASKLAPMYGLALHCQSAFQTLVPGCIYVSGLSEEAPNSFWPTLDQLAICPLQKGLKGR